MILFRTAVFYFLFLTTHCKAKSTELTTFPLSVSTDSIQQIPARQTVPVVATLTREGALKALENIYRIRSYEKEVTLLNLQLAQKDTIISRQGKTIFQLNQLVRTAIKVNQPLPAAKPNPVNWNKIENWCWRVLFVTLAATTALTK